MAKKAMEYKDEEGNKYKISFSEELQMKNLAAQRRTNELLKSNLYGKIVLIVVFTMMLITILYVFYRLDRVDFFTTLLYD